MTERGRTSSAVMAQRHEPHDSLDFFPTPMWATRALVETQMPPYNLAGKAVWEPACGEGHMGRALAEYAGAVVQTDIHDYSDRNPLQLDTHDFLMPFEYPAIPLPNWIITNPPFRLAEQFALRALDVAVDGVALFVRLQFLEGTRRWRALFADNPPSTVAVFTERVPLARGKIGTTSATAYCWLIWDIWSIPSIGRPTLRWIPPCRDKYRRPTDLGEESPGA